MRRCLTPGARYRCRRARLDARYRSSRCVRPSRLKKEKNKWTPALGKDSSKSAASVSVRDRSVATETDVRGMTLEEAILAVDLYLDNAAMQQLGEVYIIHGKGTGGAARGHARITCAIIRM